eukprot:3812565-Rhodomonas_salina.2
MQLYKRHFLPLEEHYSYGDFFSPPLQDNDIEAKPFVLLIGQVRAVQYREMCGTKRESAQRVPSCELCSTCTAHGGTRMRCAYSVGKTSFINHLLGDKAEGYPGTAMFLRARYALSGTEEAVLCGTRQ